MNIRFDNFISFHDIFMKFETLLIYFFNNKNKNVFFLTRIL